MIIEQMESAKNIVKRKPSVVAGGKTIPASFPLLLLYKFSTVYSTVESDFSAAGTQNRNTRRRRKKRRRRSKREEERGHRERPGLWRWMSRWTTMSAGACQLGKGKRGTCTTWAHTFPGPSRRCPCPPFSSSSFGRRAEASGQANGDAPQESGPEKKGRRPRNLPPPPSPPGE